jgi:hypothetical protein
VRKTGVLKQIESYIISIGVSPETLNIIHLAQAFCIEMLNEDDW